MHPLIQIFVFFSACKVCGLTKSEAIRSFLKTRICVRLGEDLTVGDVHHFAEVSGYER